ncbi:hypothetical protein, partial [Sneathiella sp. P13V-1]|uniref:hypothetical protein n=1 Tax=Sneathiella sp. P13V-1 TaxID=2697366 RepID=UPI001D11C66E
TLIFVTKLLSMHALQTLTKTSYRCPRISFFSSQQCKLTTVALGDKKTLPNRPGFNQISSTASLREFI